MIISGICSVLLASLCVNLAASLSSSEQHGLSKLTEFASVVVNEEGVYLSSPFDNVVGQYLQLFGEWEQIHKGIIRELIPTGPDTLYLDIGANIGAWAVPLGKHAAGGRVIAFEATREVAMFLAGNVVINGLQNVEIVNAVVGDQVGDQQTINIVLQKDIFQETYRSFGTFSVGGLRQQLQDHPGSVRTTPAPGVVLDVYYTEKLMRCPDFIKMDIENHEFYALKGAIKMLTECKPVLLIEMGCYHLNKSIILLLDKLGYTMSWLFAPLVRPNFVFNGNTIDSILLNKFLVITGVSQLDGNGGVNMVAVPKERSSELLKYSRSDFMVPIDILGGRFYVQDYDVVICLIDGDCAALRHVMEERDDVKICSGINIPENDILFWQSL